MKPLPTNSPQYYHKIHHPISKKRQKPVIITCSFRERVREAENDSFVFSWAGSYITHFGGKVSNSITLQPPSLLCLNFFWGFFIIQTLCLPNGLFTSFDKFKQV